jgi:histone acetyltransferase (RNA polymerase elongator complex component)
MYERGGSPIIPVFVPHLGCPRDCVFCNQRSIAAAREPDMDELHALIREGIGKVGALPELAFYGGSFTAIDAGRQEEYLRAAYEYVKSGQLSSVRISTRPDCVDAAALDRLRRYGVGTVELGAQSMEDSVLIKSNRGHLARDTRKAAALVKAYGFTLGLQMMIGLPGENEGSAEYTAREIIGCGPDLVRIYPTAVIRNTALEKMYLEGRYTPLETDEAAEICAGLIPLFEEAGIRVIRIGLNPTEELSGEVAAGVYHPAFGELCKSKLYLKNAEAELCKLAGCVPDTVTIAVGRGRTSMMVGQRKCNVNRLKERYGIKRIKVIEGDIDGYAAVLCPPL